MSMADTISQRQRNTKSMRIYLATPNNQMQADAARDMPVLLSYASRSSWVERFMPSFSHLLIDSGAYSALTQGAKIDGAAYKDWAAERSPLADAVAGLDDIAGDWRTSLKNYEQYGGFPTYHDTDPPELLDDLIPLAEQRGNWLGIGLLPPRTNREDWLRRTLDRIPDHLHIHGWAMRRYAYMRRFDSMDSTNWWRDALMLSSVTEIKHLTPAECLEIVVKRYRRTMPEKKLTDTLDLFNGVTNGNEKTNTLV